MTQGEYFRYKKNWWISLNNSGRAEPRRGRSDFNDALSALNCLRQETGEEQLRPVPFWKSQNGTDHEGFPPVGGNGENPGGAHDISNESPHVSLRAKRHKRTERPIVCRLWIKPQTCDFQFLFCCSKIVYS